MILIYNIKLQDIYQLTNDYMHLFRQNGRLSLAAENIYNVKSRLISYK